MIVEVNYLTLVMIPFSILGLLFTLLVGIGLYINGIQSAIALDQWLGTCIIVGHMADETISAWAHRGHHYKTEKMINWLFSDDNHCAKAYLSEMNGTQNDPEYRRLLGN